MSEQPPAKTPLLREPAPGWRRVLHKLWLTLFTISLLCPILSVGFEWHEARDRRAADLRLRALPSGIADIPTADLERIANDEKRSSITDFDPFESGLGAPVSVGDAYRDGDISLLREMAKLPGAETWSDDWDKVRWEGTR